SPAWPRPRLCSLWPFRQQRTWHLRTILFSSRLSAPSFLPYQTHPPRQAVLQLRERSDFAMMPPQLPSSSMRRRRAVARRAARLRPPVLLVRGCHRYSFRDVLFIDLVSTWGALRGRRTRRHQHLRIACWIQSRAPIVRWRRANMDVSLLPAISALAGSLIGGLSTLTASLITQRRQFRAQALIQEATKRESLYAEFIKEASKRRAEAWSAHVHES